MDPELHINMPDSDDDLYASLFETIFLSIQSQTTTK